MGQLGAFGHPPRRRRRALAGAIAVAALGLAGCGSAKHFANLPRPPIPVDMTVYMDGSHVIASPAKVGAGAFIVYVTNEATRPEDLYIETPKGLQIASSGSINAGQTAQINTSLKTGPYNLVASAGLPMGHLVIGRERPNSNNALLQP